jgi:hypothetical protein
MPAAKPTKAAKPSKPKAKPEPLDWRELASGPALRGLNDVLSGGTPTVVVTAPDPISVVEVTTPTDPVTPTVGYTPRWTAPEPPWVDSQGLLHEAKRVQAVREAEHSMTMGEERFYHAVWNATADVKVESQDSRTFALGYDRLARLVRLDEKSVRQLLPKLVFKRIVEILAGENSSARIGRTYRIFSPAEILRRQRASGLQHIVKKGRAVEFVWPSGHPAPTMPVTPTMGVLSVETWSSAVDAALREFALDPDTATVRALVSACRQASPDITVDEIVYFIHERGRVLRKRPVSNPLAYLMVSVPASCEPEPLRRHREQARIASVTGLSAVKQAQTDVHAMRAEWEAWLKDPAVSEEDREFARRMLAIR